MIIKYIFIILFLETIREQEGCDVVAKRYDLYFGSCDHIGVQCYSRVFVSCDHVWRSARRRSVLRRLV